MNNLANKKILITGGTGFFGKNILKYFKDYNIKPNLVTIITRDADKFKISNPEISSLSCLNFKEIDICELVYDDTVEYDYVIHAATSVIDKVESLQLINEIIKGAKNTLEFAYMAGAKSFINISSGAIYGDIPQMIRVNEDYISRLKVEEQASSYGFGKLISEHYSYLYSLNTDMKITSLRAFCFAGPYLDVERYVLGYFVQQALYNKDIFVKSGHGIYRSYLSTIDLVEWILFILIESESRATNYEVYNVGSEEAISIPDLALKVKNLLNSNSNLIYSNLADSRVFYYVPNINKIKQLGLLNNFSLDDIILNLAKNII